MTLNIAHRGARSLAPENTLAAARKAFEVGADFWEVDVAVTADEALILFHDDSLTRTTDAKKRFPDRAPWTFTTFTSSEINLLDAGSWFLEADPFARITAGEVTAEEQASFRGERIPTLQEALLFTQANNWRINVELKRLPPPMDRFPVVDRVLSLIEDLAIDPRQFVLSSFNHEWLRQVRRHNPNISLQALIGFSQIEPQDWGSLEFGTYNARVTLTDEDQVHNLKEKGIGVNLYIVNDREDMLRFIAAGAAGLITDFPQTLAGLLKKRELYSTPSNLEASNGRK
ncbi:MAG: glycerophosphodiester phosphodiesterase family protein [Desulfatiglandaceae bacterium]